MRIALVLAALAGCGSDFQLGGVLPSFDPSEVSTGHERPPLHRGPSEDPHGGGIWGHLDPGALPDVYFAVAYSTTPGWYCDACETDDVWYGYNDVHYAVIDLRGQIVWEAPIAADPYSLMHLELAPAGPGQFTAVIQPLYTDSAGIDADGFYGATNWEAWRADAVAMTVERVAYERMDEPVTHIDPTGADVDVGATSSILHVGTWPDDPERMLFLPSQGPCSADGVGDLRSVSLADVAAPVVDWPASGYAAGADEAWSFAPGIDDDGLPSALVGLASYDCETYARTVSLSVWDPDTGPLWTAPLAADTWPLQATYDPREGGGALTFGLNADTGAPIWRVTEAGAVRHGPLGHDLSMLRPGPLLEHTTDTFIDVGTRSSDGFDTLEIRNGGRVVWKIDDLRQGLSHVPVRILDVALIPG